MMQAQDIVIHVPVSQPRMLEVDAGLDKSTDNPGTILLGEDISVAGGTPEYSYRWTDPDQQELDGETVTGTSFGKYYLMVSDQQNCTAVDSVSILNGTFIPARNQSGPVIFYPNPSSGTIHVDISSFTGTIRVELIDVTGKIIRQQRILKSGSKEILTLQLGLLPEGTYLIRLSDKQRAIIGPIHIN
jgi:hypothetical protein